MKLLTNRIVISLFVIVAVAFIWEFYAKPATGPIYIVALQEYKKGNYDRSLEHLDDAYLIDPNDTSVLTLYGWNYLKKGEYNEAEPYFSRALRLNPSLPEPRLGLAHCRVAKRDGEAALKHFHALPPEYKDSNDVRLGMARAYKMIGENQAALDLLEVVYSQEPDNPSVAKELSAVAGSGSPGLITPEDRVPKPRPEELVVAARLSDGFFEVPDGENWKRIYVAGVNIGPATPGHFASEPPTDVATYLKWFSQIGALGANAVRVYTLLPPAFYHALLAYNERNPEAPIYLLQEIWLRDPPNANLFDADFTAGFEQELQDVVDVIHGQADLRIQPGRAGGIFTADVSDYVLGWLVGREIEPHVVLTSNLQNPRARSFTGEYLRVRNGNASEVWLTQRCEFLIQYEVEKYNWQRPVSIVNWPPLDPLTHTSESRMIEEWRIRREHGERLPPLKPALYDDNDAVSIDEEKIESQPALQSGFFATYHLYPFYPDFLLHEARYRSTRDGQGINSYWGYITDLKRHYRRTPVLVGEYGLSTSVGIAHFNPNGWNHGGMNEIEQGRALVRLSRNIRDAGYAGGLVFEWIDEWWKHNWIAFPFEKPFHRNALWHNDMDPEQFFGLQKFIPTSKPVYEQVFSAAGDGESPSSKIKGISLASDPSALYVTLQLENRGQADNTEYLLALNTCGRACGSRRLPLPRGASGTYPDGFNFLVRIRGTEEARLLVARNYNPYRELPVPGIPRLSDIVILRNQQADVRGTEEFEEFIIETNRRRYGRDGTFFPAERYSRSLLVNGVFDPEHPDYNSVGQWYYDEQAQKIHLRLSWGLLLVMDPSGGQIYWATDSDANPLSVESNRISLAAFAYSPDRSSSVVQILPPQDPTGAAKVISVNWPAWERLEYRQVPKKSFDILRPEFQQLTGRGG